MSKKSYMSLLKEAISEFDTSDNVEVKGPMLDPILAWDGDGELPIYKDAAGILERYYFDETKEERVNTLDEADYENDKGESSGASMKDAEGEGTDQAGTSKADTVLGSKKEKEKDIAKEAEEVDLDVDDVDDAGDDTEKMEGIDLEMENAIIEKLISEMEDDDEDADDEDADADADDDGKEIEEGKVEATDPEEDAQGAGTQQAGTGPDEGEIPPRKDIADKLVKPKEYTDENTQIEEALAALEAELADKDDEAEEVEKDEAEEVEKDAEADEEKDLDVDKELAKEAAPSAVPGGPSPKKRGEDDEDAYSEAFNIFKEAIEDEGELGESWTKAIEEDVASIMANGQVENLEEDLTDTKKTIIFGRIQRVFGDCAKKCGRIAISSQARNCKELCRAKKDQAILAAKAQAKADKAARKGKEARAQKFGDKAKAIAAN